MSKLIKETIVSKTINLNRNQNKKSPKQILENDFLSIYNIPISGGWGYSLNDTIVVNKNPDSITEKNFQTGYDLQKVFIKSRIYEELIISNKSDKFTKISWKMTKQKLLPKNERIIDYLKYRVCGFKLIEYTKLKYELSKIKDISEKKIKEHFDKILICYDSEFWFDITSFFGTDGSL